MFWRFGGYANISTIDTILDKPDFTLEELLDESDLIQELKQHNTKLIEYLREDKTLERLLEYAVAPRLEVIETPDEEAEDETGTKGKGRLLPFSRPRASSRATDTTEADDDEQEKRRNRYAFVACEVLSSDTWSIYEALTENRHMVREFWSFLSRPSPLDPLQASYFTKINESLFEKKTDDMMDLLRNLPNAVDNLLRHVECPMIMDLLLKIIALDRSEGGQGIVEWLYSQNIIPTLLSCLGPENSWVVQTAAGDFIKAIITISANASQNEQQCIGPNELTRQLVSKPCVEQLVSYMLGGGNPLTVGVGIVIEVIRKNNSDYDPDVGTEANVVPSSHDPIYLGTLLRIFAENVPKFMSLIMDAPSQKKHLDSTFGEKLEPLGFDRFKTCELMAELLHCSNMGLLNEVGAEELISLRDTERQRLRTDGKLVQPKDENFSADDLTMRMSHPAQEEPRRLEVTNADDDGFEEVEPSKEMSEDTSHEFVKAEADITLPQPASDLDKDEDDFVDEPLSSPRLTVAAEKVTEQQFEIPDLVVAPLSPSKPKPAEPVPASASTVDVPAASTEQKEGGESKDKESTDSPSASQSQETKPQDSEADVTLPILSRTGASETEKKEPETQAETLGRTISPHPEDTPAPLFSSSTVVESRQKEQSDSTAAHQPSETFNTPEVHVTEINSPGLEPTTQSNEQPKKANEPVVGDYLKRQFVEHRVVPTILSFFFAYPWNNFLHNVVYDIVQQVFNGPMDRSHNPTLAVSLFEAANITSAIINGQRVSDESHAKTKTRMGYMGHLTLIAEEVVKFTERHPPELLSETVLDRVMSQDWINYVEGALAETRERDNAILGGVRPEVALGHRGSLGAVGGLGSIGLSGISGSGSATGSNALAEAGLNGGIELSGDNNGNGIGPFAIGGTSPLMSGFGSSSDEEDEEDEDGEGDDEDVNSEFRAYTDPLNNDGSMAPPSIPPPPPPPPPLNIPPSRARLQLAARLAMHQKNNQAAEASSATLHEYDDEDDSNIANPFADGDDDFDDDDDQDTLGDSGRGAWWRGVVRRQGNDDFKDSDDENDHDDDEEFGDFAMAGDEKANNDTPENLVLKPLAVNPAKEGSRGLSGLWPFGAKNEKEKQAEEDDTKAQATATGAENDSSASHPPQVIEAKRRTSIEDPDEDEVVV
ncbi:unnamed protein product [Clonostachys rosea]|uniref:Extragenic suppressor of kinetochore protein 1 n=1 Tax=Bionectria ochroleuca TaxID=29856 RepID=A0ABY6TY94_BIOOC|nr:unnamed protein product [Clonostachys rosea]